MDSAVAHLGGPHAPDGDDEGKPKKKKKRQSLAAAAADAASPVEMLLCFRVILGACPTLCCMQLPQPDLHHLGMQIQMPFASADSSLPYDNHAAFLMLLFLEKGPGSCAACPDSACYRLTGCKT